MRVAVVNFESKMNMDENVTLMKSYINNAIKNHVDFIVFPELSLTGYEYYIESMVTLSKEKLNSIINLFLDISSENNIYISFGSPYFKGDKVFNSAIITCPNKTVSVYNKIHICGDEHKIFSKGLTPLIIETKFGKVGIGICYDTLSFPELIRYYAYSGVNLYINMSAISVMWNSLKESINFLNRAIEYHVQSNGIYIASSNACGVQNGFRYFGTSCVVGPNMINEVPIYYYCNEKLSTNPNMFTTDIDLNNNLRMIYDGNRFSDIPDFNIKLYNAWYSENKDNY